jgi:hypothetical protein
MHQGHVETDADTLREYVLSPEFKTDFQHLLQIAESLRPRKAVRLKLCLPTLTRNGETVDFQLANDTIATIPILALDAAGAAVPAPTSDTFSVVSSDPTSLGASIGTDASGSPAVVLTPLVQVSPGLTITVSDSAGLTSDAQVVDIVADLAPKAISLDTADATTTTQAAPTAPGP